MPLTSITATPKGWMPEAVRIPVPDTNFSVGHRDRKAVCLHLTLGGAASVRSEFQNATKRKSAHFLALQSGIIWQFVSVLDTAYANGLSWSASPKCWVDPEGNKLLPPHQPTWTGLVVPINPNFQTISIERELLSTAEHPSDAQNAAVVRILQYIQSQFPTSFPTYVPLISLIGHCHLSPIERANCPGPLCDYQALATAANAGAPPPPAPLRYRAVTCAAVFQDRKPDAILAGSIGAGIIEEVDDITGGWIHLHSGLGFSPLSCWVRV